MAKIQLGNFGEALAAPSQIVQAPIITASDAMHQLGEQMAQENSQQLEQLSRARMGTALAEQGAELDKMKVGIFEEVTAGTIKAEDALKVFNERADMYRSQVLDGIEDAQTKDLLAPAMEQFAIKSQADVFHQQQTYIKGSFDVEMDKQLEAAQRLSISDPETAIAMAEMTIDSVGVKGTRNQQQLEAIRQKAREQSYFTNKAYWTENTNDVAGLRAEAEKLTTDTTYIPDLSPEGRLALANGMQAKAHQIEAQMRAAENASRIQSSSEINDLTRALSDGSAVSPAILAKAEMLKGQSPQLAEALAGYNESVQLSGMTFAQQAEMVKAASNAVGVAPNVEQRQAAQIKAGTLTNAYNNGLKLFKEDPYAYYSAKTGQEVVPLTLSGDVTQMISEFGSRSQMAKHVEGLTGVNPGLLRPSEKKPFVAVLDTLPPAKQVDLLNAMFKGAPGEAAATISELSKDGKHIYGAIAEAARLGFRETKTKDSTAFRLADGYAIMRDKERMAALMPKENIDKRAMEKEFDAATQGVFAVSNEGRQIAKDLVTAVYLSKMQVAGKAAGEWSKETYRDAITIALGEITEFNGANTIPPYGWTPDKFKSEARATIKELGKSFGWDKNKTEEIMDTARLVPTSPDANGTARYHMLIGGKMFMVPDPRGPGGPLTITLGGGK